MRVHVVDPAAYTPPYDHALCSALARAGAEVTLVTTRFPHGPVPAPDGYRVRHAFYRRPGPPGARRAARLLQHVPDLLAYGRAVRHEADVVHYQWLPLQQVDWLALPRTRPRVLTAHDVLPREASFGQRAAQKRLYAQMDAVIVHSAHGARRLREEAGVPAERIHVIPHGAFDHLAALEAGPLPDGLTRGRRPVVLFLGLIRPYKGLDVLLDAWRRLSPDAELWIAGMPRMDVAALRDASPSSVRWIPRFVSDAEVAALFRAADVAVLPYREIDQSGVLFSALAFGTPMILSDVGGFPEVAATGAADLVAAGDAGALAGALGALLADPGRRGEMAAAARAAAAGTYSWDDIARRTLEVYRSA